MTGRMFGFVALMLATLIAGCDDDEVVSPAVPEVPEAPEILEIRGVSETSIVVKYSVPGTEENVLVEFRSTTDRSNQDPATWESLDTESVGSGEHERLLTNLRNTEVVRTIALRYTLIEDNTPTENRSDFSNQVSIVIQDQIPPEPVESVEAYSLEAGHVSLRFPASVDAYTSEPVAEYEVRYHFDPPSIGSPSHWWDTAYLGGRFSPERLANLSIEAGVEVGIGLNRSSVVCAVRAVDRAGNLSESTLSNRAIVLRPPLVERRRFECDTCPAGYRITSIAVPMDGHDFTEICFVIDRLGQGEIWSLDLITGTFSLAFDDPRNDYRLLATDATEFVLKLGRGFQRVSRVDGSAINTDLGFYGPMEPRIVDGAFAGVRVYDSDRGFVDVSEDGTELAVHGLPDGVRLEHFWNDVALVSVLPTGRFEPMFTMSILRGELLNPVWAASLGGRESSLGGAVVTLVPSLGPIENQPSALLAFELRPADGIMSVVHDSTTPLEWGPVRTEVMRPSAAGLVWVGSGLTLVEFVRD